MKINQLNFFSIFLGDYSLSFDYNEEKKYAIELNTMYVWMNGIFFFYLMKFNFNKRFRIRILIILA